MIKQPLVEYLDKLVAYNNNNIVVSTLFKHYMSFTDKYELIKDINKFTENITYIPIHIFKRYMDNSRWTWEND